MFVSKGLKRVTVDDLVGARRLHPGRVLLELLAIEEVFFAVFEQQSRTMLEIVRETVDSVPATSSRWSRWA